MTRMSVNGREVVVDRAPLAPLVEVLRDDLGLKGTKLGCGEGRCGACTVLLDGRAVVSCLFPVGLADGADVRTVEGLADPETGELNAAQRAMLECGGVQCGLCTPGMVVSLTALLAANPAPSEREVQTALAGNVCRCTGYRKILEAARAAASSAGQSG